MEDSGAGAGGTQSDAAMTSAVDTHEDGRSAEGASSGDLSVSALNGTVGSDSDDAGAAVTGNGNGHAERGDGV